MIGINLFLLSDFGRNSGSFVEVCRECQQIRNTGSLPRSESASLRSWRTATVFPTGRVAERTGVSLPVIARAALFGIVPTTRALIKIADALELSFSYLLGSTEKNDLSLPRRPLRLAARLEECAKNGRYRTARSRRACPSRARIFTNGEKTILFPLPSICLRSHPILPFRPIICRPERITGTETIRRSLDNLCRGDPKTA